MDTASDIDLIEAVLAGEREAFATLVDRHLSPVFLALRLQGMPAEDAIEVTRETMLAGYTDLSQLRSPGALASRLHAQAEREAMSFQRRRRPTTAYHALNPTSIEDPRSVAEKLWRTAARLPEDYRAIFFQKHLLGRSCREIAGEAQMSVGAVRSRLEHAYDLERQVLETRCDTDDCRHLVNSMLMGLAGESEECGALAKHLLTCSPCREEQERITQVLGFLPVVARQFISPVEQLAEEVKTAASELPVPRSESQWPSRMLWAAILVTGIALALAIWGVAISAAQ